VTQPQLASKKAFCADTHRADFVEQMRSVPGPIALVCSGNSEDRTGMAATAWNSLCADPPMLLVCVNHSASAHQMIKQNGRFSLNLLDTSDVETVAIFSSQRGLKGKDRFIADQWQDGPLGQPLYVNAVTSFECELEAVHSHGTHDIFIGRVTHMAKGSGTSPLIYLDGKFCEPTAFNNHGSKN